VAVASETQTGIRAQRGKAGEKDREGGGLRKLRLRSRIISHSFSTAPHAEDRERKGRRNTRRANEEGEEGEQRNDHGNNHIVSA